MRVSTAVACTGFASLGLVSAGLLDGLPPVLRVLAVLLALVLVPAHHLLRLTVPAANGAPGGAGALAVVGVLALHALLAQAFAWLGLSLGTYAGFLVWASLAGLLAWMLLAWRKPSTAAGRIQPRAGVVMWALLVLIAVFARPEPGPAQDAFDHIGYLRRAIVSDQMRPGDMLALPIDATANLPPDPRKGALHDLFAAVATVARAEPDVVWGALPIVLFPVAVGAFGAFAAFFVGVGAAWYLTVALFLLSFAGTVFQFAPSVAYGQHLAVTLYWALACLALATARTDGTRAGTLLVMGATLGGVFAHAGVALHAVILSLTLGPGARALGLARGPATRTAIIVAACAIAAAAVRLLAGGGDTNPIHAHAQGLMTVGRLVVASPMEVLREHGLVFLGGLAIILPLALAARARSDVRRIVVFSILPLGLAFIPPVSTALADRVSYMLMRVLLNAPALPAVVLAFVVVLGLLKARRFLTGTVAALALVAWSFVFVLPTARAFVAEARALSRVDTSTVGDDEALAFARALPSGTVVLTDPATAYRLSAFTSVRLVAVYEQHANPLDPFALDRLRAVRDVISPWADGAAAAAACERYGVDVVLLVHGSASGGFLSSWRPEQFDAARVRLAAMPASFQPLVDRPDVAAYRFARAVAPERPGYAVSAPVRVENSPLVACVAATQGTDPFELTGIAIAPEPVFAGDSLVITLGYRRDLPGSFDFPRMVHVRFDHADVSAQPRYPGEKGVRRVRERTSGVFERYRADLEPGHGVYEPDLWPMGVPLRESFRVVLPASLRPGRYRVEVRVAEQSMVPNFALSDLVFNRDHYSGNPCATIEILARDGLR